MPNRPVLIFALLATLAAPAAAQQVVPAFDLDSLSPAAGWQTEQKITVTGDFTDDRGFRDIEYRIRGKGGWKSASFNSEGTVASGTITATFTINLKLQRQKYTRVEIRAVDVDGNESDYITRRYRWDRYGFVVRDETTTGTNTGTDSGTDTGTDTGSGTGNGNGGTANPGTTDGNRDGTDTSFTDGTGIIQEFTISPSGAFEPVAATLTWNAPGAATVIIDQGIGVVAASGTLDVGVISTTTPFTITATTSEGAQETATVTIFVQALPFPF